MIKVFISQPMKNKNDEDILREREAAKERIVKNVQDEIFVLDSFFQGDPANASPLWYLGESLKMLSTADIAYFAPGWSDARGCKIEHYCAVSYGIPAIDGEESD